MLFLLTILYLSYSSTISCQVSNCSVCSSHSPLICTICMPGFTLTTHSCIKQSITNQYLTTNCIAYSQNLTCTHCKSGFTLSLNNCLPECNKDCNCIEPNVCIDSNPDTKTSKQTPKLERKIFTCDSTCAYCDSSTGYCTSCNSGYYLFFGYCLPCSNACKYCDSFTYCNTCDNGYYLYSFYCSKCMDNCKSCKNYYSCETCDSGYYYSDSECKYDESSIYVLIILPCLLGTLFIVIISIVICCCRRYRKMRSLNANRVVVIATDPNPEYVVNLQVNPLIINPESIGSSNAPYAMCYNTDLNDDRNDFVNLNNFVQVVPLVGLDENLKYNMQDTCLYCNKQFSRDQDTRVLPCGHPYHGICVYNSFVLSSNKMCLACRRQYY